jgi:hypothetical protein
MTKLPRTIAGQAQVDGSALENGLPVANQEQLEGEIRHLLATETDPVLLSNKLFSQEGGLFGQLANSEPERRKVAQSPLFRQAQERLMELRQRELAARRP